MITADLFNPIYFVDVCWMYICVHHIHTVSARCRWLWSGRGCTGSNFRGRPRSSAAPHRKSSCSQSPGGLLVTAPKTQRTHHILPRIQVMYRQGACAVCAAHAPDKKVHWDPLGKPPFLIMFRWKHLINHPKGAIYVVLLTKKRVKIWRS